MDKFFQYLILGISALAIFMTILSGCDKINCRPDIRIDKNGKPIFYGIKCGRDL